MSRGSLAGLARTKRREYVKSPTRCALRHSAEAARIARRECAVAGVNRMVRLALIPTASTQTRQGNFQMKTSTKLLTTSLLALLSVSALAAETATDASRPNRGDVANARLDARGERINERLDAKGERIDERLD